MVSFEERVISFQKENEDAQRIIVKGTDEHLDLLLIIKKVLDPLTKKFEDLMSEIIPKSNNLSLEEVNKFVPSLLDLYSSSIKLVAILKRSKYVNDIKSSSQKYYSQVENLRELIYDLEHFRSSDDDDLNEVLRKINNS
jgi:hypothetical protein